LKLREPFVFLTDRCLGRYEVPDAVRAALAREERLERLDDHYAPNAADAVWITEVGAKGWVVLTKDSAMRSNPLEVMAMLSARTAVFIFGNANVGAKQIAGAFTTALPRIRTAVRRFKVGTHPKAGRAQIARLARRTRRLNHGFWPTTRRYHAHPRVSPSKRYQHLGRVWTPS